MSYVKCPVVGCTRLMRGGSIMCHHHWRNVPRPVQRMVIAKWNGGKPKDGYAAARALAFAHVPVTVI